MAAHPAEMEARNDSKREQGGVIIELVSHRVAASVRPGASAVGP
jgi:hypothetical protein